MRLVIIIISILSLVSSCKIDHKKSSNKEIEKLVMYWHNRKIIMPDYLKTLKKNKNISPNCLNDTRDSKIITVISGNCQMCIQEIHNWIPFFDRMKKEQISNRLYFIIEHTNLEYFEKIYADDLPPELNILIDESGKLSELNHFPKDKKYRTMLLDKNNKVLLIGSPLSSLDMNNLFLKELKTNIN